MDKLIHVPHAEIVMEGMLKIPEHAKGIVLFAHGSGSSRHSPRNNVVATLLNEAGLATLLIDLLSLQEDAIYQTRFDIALLTERLGVVAEWLSKQAETEKLPLGLFGASTGAASALQLASQAPKAIKAIVSRGGRPDLALPVLNKVIAPTLIIVGGNDFGVLELNEKAFERLNCEKKLEIVPRATHLFEEPGTLEEVSRLAKGWFLKYLAAG